MIDNIKDAREAMQKPDAVALEANLAFYDGDHWQEGKGWSGAMPADSHPDYSAVYAEIEKGYVSKNSTKEVVDRVVSSVLGKEPKFVLKFSDGTRNKTKLKEAEDLIKLWMKEKEFINHLSEALANALLTGSASVRLFIPAGFVEDGQVDVNPNKPLERVYFQAPHPLSSSIVNDEDTMEKTSIFFSTYKDENTDKDKVELSYLLDEVNDAGERLTEIKIVKDGGKDDTVQLDLNGKLIMFELKIPRLITNQIISLQKLQNLNLTMMQRNSNLGGFLERVILNGQMPGHYEDDGTGSPLFVRDEFITGAGTVNAINGVPYQDNDGNTIGYTQASVSYRDPVSPQTFLQAQDQAYKGILEECEQLHALLTGDAISSGDSRRQALSSYQARLKQPKQAVEGAVEWMVETLLAFAGFLSGDTKRFAGIEATVEAILDFGQVSAGEIDLLERQVRIGIISIETAREKIGIENTEDEANKVQEELAVREQAMKVYSGTNPLDDNRNKSEETDA
jgi:hypothetical protein